MEEFIDEKTFLEEINETNDEIEIIDEVGE